MSEFGIPERWSLAAVQLMNKFVIGGLAKAMLTANLKSHDQPEFQVAFAPGAEELVARPAVNREPQSEPIAYV